MGGSFDPVHAAHVALADVALRHLQLDEVRWVPVGQPWQKARQLAPATDRVEMVRLATAHEPRFVVDTIEVDRPGPSYTLDTFEALQGQARSQNRPTEWFLIIGQDQLANLPTWHGWQTLVQGLTLAVARRGSATPVPPPELRAMACRMATLPMPALTISSTEIRARVSGGGDPMDLAPDMVPKAVARYIANHQLYAAGRHPLNGHP